MPEVVARWAAYVTAALAALGIGYYIAAIIAAFVYKLHLRATAREIAARKVKGEKIPQPSVSILKPLKGMDPSMMEAFRSHCKQQYAGEYELIFGVARMDDAAVQAVEELKREYPGIAITLVHAPERLGANGKVSTLIQMLPAARHEVILINDSDILVTPHYLERVAAAFALKDKRTVGMVTALYRGRPHGTLWSRLEALGIATDFQASVLLSRMVEGVKFALGSTLAIRREALEKIGGLEPLVNHLADDYEMGKRVHDAGYAVHICSEAVETGIAPYHFGGFVSHQLRWARTVRDARPFGYAGLLVSHGLALAMVNLVVSGLSIDAIFIFMMSFFARITLAMEVGAGVLSDHEVLPGLLLLPLRDGLHLILWCLGFFGRTIHWRGEEFVLNRGVLTREQGTGNREQRD
jgi:ceramide glucosyltransferase